MESKLFSIRMTLLSEDLKNWREKRLKGRRLNRRERSFPIFDGFLLFIDFYAVRVINSNLCVHSSVLI